MNFLKELKILINDFFFGSNLRSTSPMPLVPRPFLKISFFFFFFFLKILEILNFFMELKFLIDIYFFFLKNLEILNFFKELKILNFFFFFWKIWKSWIFEKKLINEFFFEKFGSLEFFQGIEKIWLMIFFFFWKI